MKKTLGRIEAAALPRESNIKPVVLGAVAILVVLVSTYVYFLGKIVFDVIARREAESSIRLTQSSVSQLQVAYFNTTRGLTMDNAAAFGLSEAKAPLYASRTGASSVALR